MPAKRLHILANSVRNQQHCIAGRELIEQDGDLYFGGWIRPVSRHGEGELSWEDCHFGGGRTPRIFDIVEISFAGREGSASQPENCIIEAGRPWRKIKIAGQLPGLIVESPRQLWHDPAGREDRISPRALASLHCGCSLHLIRVTGFSMQFGWREYDGKFTQRRRALFSHGGQRYDFSLTDPMMDKYCRPYPGQGEEAKSVRLSTGDGCLLCVSLSLPFNGYHYKIVAAVIENTQ